MPGTLQRRCQLNLNRPSASVAAPAAPAASAASAASAAVGTPSSVSYLKPWNSAQTECSGTHPSSLPPFLPATSPPCLPLPPHTSTHKHTHKFLSFLHFDFCKRVALDLFLCLFFFFFLFLFFLCFNQIRSRSAIIARFFCLSFSLSFFLSFFLSSFHCWIISSYFPADACDADRVDWNIVCSFLLFLLFLFLCHSYIHQHINNIEMAMWWLIMTSIFFCFSYHLFIYIFVGVCVCVCVWSAAASGAAGFRRCAPIIRNWSIHSMNIPEASGPPGHAHHQKFNNKIRTFFQKKKKKVIIRRDIK